MIGTTISHYKIIEKLGSGGMGDVYKAEDTVLQRQVALKFLPYILTRDEEAQHRFIHEARAASALDHSNIGTIHEIDEQNGQFFIAMAYYPGITLKGKIEQGPIAFDDVVDIAVQMAEGLAKAHGKEIIHRDIKPANVIITEDGVVKIIDFGLAKLRGQTVLTKDGTTMGSVAYMSPEQTHGADVDYRSDIWALGVVLYEMLTGEHPFKGDYEQAIIYSILHEEPVPVRDKNPDVPAELERIVDRALHKMPDERYASVEEVLHDLKQYQEGQRTEDIGAVGPRALLRYVSRPRVAVPLMCVLFVALVALVWYFNRQTEVRWAREVALPEIQRLVESSWRDYTDAYALAEQVEVIIPGDPALEAAFATAALHININTEPSGATVYMKEYDEPDGKWEVVGVSPIDSVRVPVGIFRWKLEKEGYEPVHAVATTWDIGPFGGRDLLVPHDFMRVVDEQGSLPPGMVRVPGVETPEGRLGDFFIDKYEVTNRQYKAFMDSGGYRNNDYWQHEFVKEGRVLTWEEAMAEFVDQTDRPGPATWQAGDYPEGEDDYPVAGVSWYEAAAFAAYAGRSLPTGQHWGVARGEYTTLIRWPQLGGFAVFAPFSNFSSEGTVAVGSLPGVTSYGAYDMAGNVREWCWNEAPAGRVVRGGAWGDNTYRFTEMSQVPPFDRSPKNGFRTAHYPDPEAIPGTVFEAVTFGAERDYYTEEPVSDEIFQIYKEQFSYDPAPLNARVVSRDESAEDWVYEQVTYAASYDGEEMMGHLFLPKNASPPYQTVIYFPGSAALFQESSDDLASYYEFPVFLSFLVKNGRAVLFPVYEGTFERRDNALVPVILGDNSHAFTDYLIKKVEDFKRSIDYLETREDIDSEKLAYYGMSWGGWLGAIIPAVEERPQTAIVLSGGFNGRGRPEADQINYVGRVKMPVLMLNGKYDTIFPYDTTVQPMFDLLGTPDEHKALKFYETDHIPPMNDTIREILGWLDRYLGPVGAN